MLPEEFKERMKEMLGDEYPRFISVIENEDAVKGVRVNRLKCKSNELPTSLGARLEKLSYVSNGYILDTDIRIGSTPEHHAGMIYSQDPGAMATVAAAVIKEDFKVADLCSAPGGKSTQAAEMLGDGGFILCNEYVPKRAKILVGNLERMGVKNAMVTSLDTSYLKEMFDEVFDLVICDAPCSGEGMFRKSTHASQMWNQGNVLACKSRQTDILNNGASMVKGGGYLLYSTCTYSKEENEEVVSDFLLKNPNFSLVEVSEELKKVTRDGLTAGFPEEQKLQLCRRFYPHVSRGEGQFLALMKKEDTGSSPRFNYKDSAKAPSREEHAATESFFREALTEAPRGRVAKVGDNLVLISHGCPIPERSVFMPGVLLGEVRGGILRPSHQFFSCYGELFKIKIDLEEGDPRVDSYLSGEEIKTDNIGRGWCVVTYHGAVLGGGKLSGNAVKNHYPKGLRN